MLALHRNQRHYVCTKYHQFYFRHLAHIYIKHTKTYSKTQARNIQITQLHITLIRVPSRYNELE